MTRLSIVLVLSLVGLPAARAEEVSTGIPRALDGLAWLVGGQWNSTPVLPGGRRIEARLVAEWGPGRMSIRMRTFMRSGGRDVQTYESLLLWHPHRRRIETVTFAPGGAVHRGTGSVDHRALTLEQSASGGFPPMRQVFAPGAEDPNRYVGKIFFRRGEEWTEVVSAVSTRTKIGSLGPPAEVSEKARSRLEPVVRLTESMWTLRPAREEAAEDCVLVAEASLRGTLLVLTRRPALTRRPDVLSVTWWDAGRKALRSIRCDAAGGVAEGAFTIDAEEGRWTRRSTLLEVGEKTCELEEVFLRASPDRFELRERVRADADAEWAPRSGPWLVVRREK